MKSPPSGTLKLGVTGLPVPLNVSSTALAGNGEADTDVVLSASGYRHWTRSGRAAAGREPKAGWQPDRQQHHPRRAQGADFRR